jgi:trans-aconitate methyltransferase
MMVRGNAAFNRWVVDTVADRVGHDLAGIVELGCGPGVGLERLLRAFPEAQVWGIDRSPVMIAQSERRNRREVKSGRLRLVRGEVSALSGLAPVDLVVAVHLLYFWHQPEAELARIRAALRPGAKFAIGYRLRKDMPRVSQRQFPAEGHRLYDSDQEVVTLFQEAGFRDAQPIVQEPTSGQGSSGRLVIGTA